MMRATTGKGMTYTRVGLMAVVLAGLLAGLAGAAEPAGDAPSQAFLLTSKDQVVFYGDALFSEPAIPFNVEVFLRSRYPKLTTRFTTVSDVNPGTIRFACDNFEQDVAVLKPTKLVVCYGWQELLDEAYQPAARSDEDFARMEKELDELFGLIKATGAQTWVMTPPVPDVAHNAKLAEIKFDETVARLAGLQKQLAKKHGFEVLDWHGLSQSLLTRYLADNPPPPVVRPNGYLPGEVSTGGAADLLLTAWRAEPIEVTLRADWTTGTASANHGKLTGQPANNGVMVITLEGMPLVYPYAGASMRYTNDVPVHHWCQYNLVLDNAPASGITVAEPGRRIIPVVAPRLRDGSFDLSTMASLLNAQDTVQLRQAVFQKDRFYDMYRRQKVTPLPEPEYARAQELFIEAAYEQWKASVKVLDRTPRTLNVSLALTDVQAAVNRQERIQPHPSQTPLETPAQPTPPPYSSGGADQ